MTQNIGVEVTQNIGPTLAAEGGISGTLQADLQPLQSNLSGIASVDGPLQSSFAALEADLSGIASIDGPMISSLSAMTCDFEGIASIGGAITAELQPLSASLQGEIKMLNFTTNGTLIQTEDRPSDNHATINENHPATNATISNDARTMSGGTNVAAVSTFGLEEGIWSFKWQLNGSVSGSANVGVAISTDPSNPSSSTDSVYYSADGQKRVNGTYSAYGSAFTNANEIEIIIDIDGGEVTFYRDGVSQGAISHTFDSNSVYHARGFCNSVSGGADFTFSGYTPQENANLQRTSNLPEVENFAQNYFNTVLYTGNATTGQSITSAGFQPDFVWAKRRASVAETHYLYDVVRGVNNGLQTPSTAVEFNQADSMTSFDSDGFTLGTSSTSIPNANTGTYVAWLWKAGGAAVSNTNGSIASLVSAASAGHFSIVSYTGTGANASVGHSLGGTPDLIIIKNRDVGRNWTVQAASIMGVGNNDYLMLDQAGAEGFAGSISAWNNTQPDSSVFSLGSDANVNESTRAFIAYCFKSIPGVCKVGSYTGNNSSNGPLIELGFKARWLMIKCVSAGSTAWIVYDTERDTVNPAENPLAANTSGTEPYSSVLPLDIFSNGFKIKTGTYAEINTVQTYLYVAIADTPFGGINVPPSTAR